MYELHIETILARIIKNMIGWSKRGNFMYLTFHQRG